MTDNFPTKSLLGLSLYVEEVASQNKVQPSMVAQAALAAFATSVQRNFRVETWYNKSKSIDLNVAMIAVAKSGERKSSIYKEFMKPLLDYMRKAEPAYKIELKTANAIEATNKTARNSLAMQYHKASAKDKDGFFADLREVGNEPNPISPRLIINDATVEAIADHLANSRPSIIYMSDEGGKLFANYSMKQENKTNSMAYFNGLLDGEYTSVYRKSSDDLIVQDHSMSMLVFIQPEILKQIVDSSGANFGQGFFQRFLWNYPPSMIGSRQVDPDDILNVADVALSQGYDFNMVIENAFQKECEWTPNPKVIALEDNARRQLAIFHNELDANSEIGAKYDQISGFTSKIPEITTKIACLLYLYEYPNGDCVTGKYVQNAILISRYFIEQANQIFGPDAKEELLAKKLYEFLIYKYPNGVEPRSILREGPTALRNTEKRNRAIVYCEKKGWLFQRDGKIIPTPLEL